MKIAIVQDELVRKGGGEQVTLSFHQAFPDAPIYTLSYNADRTFPEFKSCDVRTSWFGRYVKDDVNLRRFFFPIGIWSMQALNLEAYDVILMSTTHCAKYVKVARHALVITYCHTPFRLAWAGDTYSVVSGAKLLKKMAYNWVIKRLQQIDRKAAQKTHWFLTNSSEVKPRIEKAYAPKQPVTVINPPVRCSYFHVSNENEKNHDYYLIVSRFEPYKKIDLVIEAFNQMPGKKLVIVGKGSQEPLCRQLAAGNPNIMFKSGLPANELADLYAGCKALINPQHEDYGIAPLEANASGRPVIAYGVGGVLDSMVPYTNDASKATALFFKEQTRECLVEAVNQFETLTFDPVFIRKHALKFDEGGFVEAIKNFVENKYQLFFTGKTFSQPVIINANKNSGAKAQPV
ncbi:glycosyltransferase [Deminuibacter soli]|uniref:Glycosyltransferase family 4 protein n=1 Tax=Deminuibacter soli TaxID=2291815 RepID=A0A3E1NNH0_9BACT|nr:glycosyltransferase [Deminuibacter soli]RFM29485.1 glycosyltransferase family 4 protein [Deminuibacter soli]